MAADTKSFWKSKGFNDYGNFTAVPNFITKDLMAIGHGIPPYFWKFTIIAWRHWLKMEPTSRNIPGGDHTGKGALWVCSRRFSYTQQQLADEYSLTNENTAWCTACYRVSAFCSWEKGRRYNFKLPGSPTTLHYREWTTENDWKAFIAAIKVQRREDRLNHHGGSDDAFSVDLAWKVREQRATLKLPTIPRLEEYLAEMKATGVIRADGTILRQKAKAIDRAAVSQFSY